MIKYILGAFQFSLMLLIITGQNEQNNISIEVTNLKNDKGFVLISLYDNDKDFPDNADKAVRKARVKINGGIAKAEFNLKKGKYAAAILHDENNNLAMDFNILGIPKEGYGFSNNAKGTLGPPSFNKASFEVNESEKKVVIKTSYFN